MVCRCARRAQELGPQGDRHVPGANCGAAGAPAPLSQNCSACRSREQTGIGSVCASALCCHPADLPLSTSLCTHGKNIGKLGTGKRRNGEYAEAFSMNVEVLWIVPIPGTTKLSRLEENIGAVAVELTSDDLREIESAASKITVQGTRYSEHLEQRTG